MNMTITEARAKARSMTIAELKAELGIDKTHRGQSKLRKDILVDRWITRFWIEPVHGKEKEPNGQHRAPQPADESPAKVSLGDRIRKGSDVRKAPHLIIEARAGTGKTTTLIEGLKILKGKGTSFTPSPQQEAIWEELLKSVPQGKFDFDGTACFVAFNRSIAKELKQRVPFGVDAMTMHGMGMRAIRGQYNLLQGDNAVQEFRTRNLIEIVTGTELRKLFKNRPEYVRGTESLVKLVKQNLTDTDPDSLRQLVSHYDLDLENETNEIFDLVPDVIYRSMEVDEDRYIDYDDMVWLPIVNDLPVKRYDLLLVDEAQDLNRSQQELAKRAGSRIILCGDTHQAIYGFAGADNESMSRMENALASTPKGCNVLPLTFTRRCGSAIVKEANKIVPDFHAVKETGVGKVNSSTFAKYADLVEPTDMILCRVNAPLVSHCFRFITDGKKAFIQGRDLGKGLIKLINRLEPDDVADLMKKLEAWRDAEFKKENALKFPSENKLIIIGDKFDMIAAFCEGNVTVANVRTRIQQMFEDDGVGICLSSVHRAKGLESNHVFILMPKDSGMPHPMAKTSWEKEQEMNLKYVAITRAEAELTWVFE